MNGNVIYHAASLFDFMEQTSEEKPSRPVCKDNDSEKVTQKQKKRTDYDMTYRRVQGERSCYGTLHKETPNIYPLAPIGTKVIVKEKVQFLRSKSKRDYGWITPSAYKDAFNAPMEYVVVGYTLGIDNPMDKSNKVILETTCKGGKKLRALIGTIYLASGSMKLLVV